MRERISNHLIQSSVYTTAKGREYFQVPVPLPSDQFFTEALSKASPILLRRRRLICLDAFLGGREIWVFQCGDDVSDIRMYLSTDLEVLTDLWGPCWRLYRDTEPEKIQSIEIGNGCILPWSTSGLPGDTFKVPQKIESVVYCYWISF
jgi:hypothetical protein